MAQDIDPEFDSMGSRSRILEIFFKINVRDLRSGLEIIIGEKAFRLKTIVAEDEGSVGEEPVIEYVVESQGAGGIAPVGAKGVF